MTKLLGTSGVEEYRKETCRIRDVHSRIRHFRDTGKFFDLTVKTDIPVDEDGEYLFHLNRVEMWFTEPRQLLTTVIMLSWLTFRVYFTSLDYKLERVINQWVDKVASISLALKSRYQTVSKKGKIRF